MIVFTTKSFAELSATELYALLQLRSEIFVVEQNCAYQDCDGKDEMSMHLLGFENNVLVSYARLLPKGVSYENYASIGRVATKFSVRKKGFGKLLMLEAIKYCKKHFGTNIKISAQAYLEKFYQDLGFVTISAPYLEDDIPHIAMTLK